MNAILMPISTDRQDYPAPAELGPRRHRCQVRFLGRVPYLQAWQHQVQLAAEIARGRRPATLLLLEHPHTFTLGRGADESHLLWSPERCQERHVEVHWVDRGGDITYHGPGQLVAYPLLPLGRLDATGRLPSSDYIGYLRRLERVVIRTLADFGVAAVRRQGLTGVWTSANASSNGNPRPPFDPMAKIAAIGVKVDSRGVSRHGFALNLAPDMSYWNGIVPCGLPDYSVVSLAQLLPKPPTLRQLAGRLAEHFGKVFGFELLLEE